MWKAGFTRETGVGTLGDGYVIFLTAGWMEICPGLFFFYVFDAIERKFFVVKQSRAAERRAKRRTRDIDAARSYDNIFRKFRASSEGNPPYIYVKIGTWHRYYAEGGAVTPWDGWGGRGVGGRITCLLPRCALLAAEVVSYQWAR